MTHVIPENFVDTGRCFNGMFRTRNLIEGIAFAIIPGRLVYTCSLELNRKITLFILVVGMIVGLFVIGINGDSILEFLSHSMSYKKKKRIARYNPRVKTEAAPEYLTNTGYERPVDRIRRRIDEMSERRGSTNEAISSDIYDPIYQEFFLDDKGIVETPEDLKPKPQRYRESLARKREAKRTASGKRIFKKRRGE